MTYYRITFPKFNTILAHNLTDHEIQVIKNWKDKLSYDEYAGYSPKQQQIRKNIKRFVKQLGKYIPSIPI